MSNSKAATTGKKTAENEKIKWGPVHIETFLETFQNYELLWNVRHEDYSNKAKRESYVLRLKEDLVSQGVAVPDVAFLRARIKTIKTTYRSELLKVLASKSSGAGADELYTPKLPWFKIADTFLNSVVVTRDSQSNLRSDLGDNNEEQESISILDNQGLELGDSGTPIAVEEATGSITQNTPFATPISKKRRLSKLSKVESAINKLQNIVTEREESSKKKNMDEFDVFGQHIANQLRTLPARSSAILQAKFQSLITAEKLKHLPPDSSPFTSTTSSHQTDEDDDLTEVDPELYNIDDGFIYTQLP